MSKVSWRYRTLPHSTERQEREAEGALIPTALYETVQLLLHAREAEWQRDEMRHNNNSERHLRSKLDYVDNLRDWFLVRPWRDACWPETLKYVR